MKAYICGGGDGNLWLLLVLLLSAGSKLPCGEVDGPSGSPGGTSQGAKHFPVNTYVDDWYKENEILLEKNGMER